MPPRERIAERLSGVRATIYLIFNEGYAAASGPALVRSDLSREATRLARMLCRLLPDDRENEGLLALTLLHGSRTAARCSSEGDLITLDEQDRTLWDQDAIREGLSLVEAALRKRQPGPYQLQAAIAAVHASAARAQDTDWKQIAALYRELQSHLPSPVISLNCAVAVALGWNIEAGLRMIDGLAADLDSYYMFHAARADLLRRIGRLEESAQAYKRAIELTSNEVEQRYLLKRLRDILPS